jgi:chromosome segregation ATPase
VNLKEEERKIGSLKPVNPTKWIEMNQDDLEDHEDEIRALQKARNDYDNDNSDSEDEDENLNKKRKRHDTDDENSVIDEKKYDTEDELNELLPQKDEDGDIILESKTSVVNTTKNGLISLNEYRTNVLRRLNRKLSIKTFSKK